MKIFRKLLPAAIILALSVTITVLASAAHDFTDVTRYDDAIETLSKISVVKGLAPIKFGPDEPVTRWQMALFIARLATGVVDNTVWEAAANTTSFTDVYPQHYYGSIAYAHKAGIIIGKSDEIFAPEEPISYQDGLTMLVRALGYPSVSLNIGYPESYINRGSQLGLNVGISGLNYTDYLTRGHVAQLLYNTLFAAAYDDKTIAEKVFTIRERKIVLTATENMKINLNVSYAKPGELIFSEMTEYGLLKNPFKLPSNLFNLSAPNEYIGMAYTVTANDDYSVITNTVKESSRVISESYLTNLSVNANSSVLTIGGANYTVVDSFTYKLTAPSYDKQVIVYGMNGVFRNCGTVVTARDIANTTQYYKVKAYDDNNDNAPDRLFYSPYSFGQFKTDTAGGGKIAIAGGYTRGAVTMTGITPKEGDYVLYSFNPQTMTLDIMRVFEIKEGLVRSNSYSQSLKQLIIDNATYNIGNEFISGLKVSELEAPLLNVQMSSLYGRKVSYIADVNTILYYKLADASGASGKIYGANIGIITSIPNIQSGVYTIILDNSVVCGVGMLNGSVPSYSSFDLAVGDMVEYDAYESPSGRLYRVTKITSAPTYTTKQPASTMSVVNNLFQITENAAVTEYYPIGALTKIFVINSNGVVEPAKTAAVMAALNNTTYQAVYVAHDSSLQYAAAIYIRPLDMSVIGSTSEYTSIVYISSYDINNSLQLTNARRYTALDLMSGSTVSVSLSAQPSALSPSVLSSAGYYKVNNGFIINANPIIENNPLPSSTLCMYKEQIIRNMTKMSDRYMFTLSINNTTFNVLPSDIKLYVRYQNSGTISPYADLAGFAESTQGQSYIGTVDIIYYRNMDYLGSTYVGSVAIIINYNVNYS